MGKIKTSKIFASIITLFTFAISFFTFDSFAFLLAIPIFVITSVWIIDDVSKDTGGGIKALKYITIGILTLVVGISLYFTFSCEYKEFDEYKTTPLNVIYFDDTYKTDSKNVTDNDIVFPQAEKTQNRQFWADRYIFSPKENTMLYTEDIKGFSYVCFALGFILCELLLLIFDIIVDTSTRPPTIYENNDYSVEQKKLLRKYMRAARLKEKQSKN